MHGLEVFREGDTRPIGKVLGADDLGAVFPRRAPVRVFAIVGVLRVLLVGGRGGTGAEALVEVGWEGGFAGFEVDVGLDEGLGVGAGGSVRVVFIGIGIGVSGEVGIVGCALGFGDGPSSSLEEEGGFGGAGHHGGCR